MTHSYMIFTTSNYECVHTHECVWYDALIPASVAGDAARAVSPECVLQCVCCSECCSVCKRFVLPLHTSVYVAGDAAGAVSPECVLQCVCCSVCVAVCVLQCVLYRMCFAVCVLQCVCCSVCCRCVHNSWLPVHTFIYVTVCVEA